MPKKYSKLATVLFSLVSKFDLTDIEDIYLAGTIPNKRFNYKRWFETLADKDESGKMIYFAGIEWKQFDYERGLDALIKIDNDERYIYEAGMNWKDFNFKKALAALVGTPWYDLAKENWGPVF